MTDLSLVRAISQSGVRLVGRHDSGARPTGGWQDKSRSLFAGRSAADGRKINDLAQCACLSRNVH
jgi:hypothetical protein